MCGRQQVVVAEARRIDGMIINSSDIGWHAIIDSARIFITSLDGIMFFSKDDPVDLQTLVVQVVQKVAYHNVDAGPISDIAEWCLSRWLRILQYFPRDATALRGAGQWWLSKAQPSLARIHAIDGSSSSSEGSLKRPGSDAITTHNCQEEGDTTQANSEAEMRLHSPDYVEARGILLPAVEYLRRAVDEAQNQEALGGDLLITTAEAYMSLGNVSYSGVNEEYFRQAILYLRRASDVSGFPLPSHLQRYLEDYGRFVD
ncbi:hypothetical protein EJ08DRAFT_655504 [Tothia fuscella]|uniref:Uncharacterized protein n=1 Tax=Tothia fuscella TaxID=1048955 RepID=A0A9P4P4M1_9PEZI|nr:hypothetical protein EJ08DRAFT_655504 [Tothia fuscella]